MCVVSMVGDVYTERWKNLYPPEKLNPINNNYFPTVSREEFDHLKREVEMLKELLKKAKEYDEKTNQPDCEQEEKIALIKKVAEMVGVDLKDVLG